MWSRCAPSCQWLPQGVGMRGHRFGLYMPSSGLLVTLASGCGYRLPGYLVGGESWLHSMEREVCFPRRDGEAGSHWLYL